LHAPQLSGSVCVGVQAPRQMVCPAGHWHTPELQDCPVAQVFPHAPQLATLVASAASQPFVTLRSQSWKPALQLTIAQRSLAQVADALAMEHTTPQAPQLEGLLVVLVSQPLSRLASQSPQPASQLATHAPAVQVGVERMVLQTRVHEPHAVTLVLVSTHAPEQQVAPVAQPRVGVQPGTHIPPVQRLPIAQSVLARQPTHTRRGASQMGAPATPTQSEPLRQPGAHRRVASQ
jgi:hypothetical protein